MTAVRVFDPAMCCSSGVCGPAIDPQLARFAADLDWLKTKGVSVERFNLAQQPAAFADDTAVKRALEEQGEAGLPLVQVDGEVRSIGVYPSRAELASWAAVSVPEAEPKPTSGGDCCGAASVAAPKEASTACCAPTSGDAGAKSGCC